MAASQGRRWMNRLQRYQRDVSYARASLLTNGTCRRSMLRPAKPSMAGSRVTEAAMVTSTARTTVNGEAGHGRLAHQQDAEHRDDHGETGEEDGASGGRDRGERSRRAAPGLRRGCCGTG